MGFKLGRKATIQTAIETPETRLIENGQSVHNCMQAFQEDYMVSFFIAPVSDIDDSILLSSDLAVNSKTTYAHYIRFGRRW